MKKKLMLFIAALCCAKLWSASNTEISEIKKSAEKGDAVSQFKLGEHYESQNDKMAAFFWYQKSADSGDADGMYNLAMCYMNGFGCSKSLKNARTWLEKAKEAGCTKASSALKTLEQKEISTGQKPKSSNHKKSASSKLWYFLTRSDKC